MGWADARASARRLRSARLSLRRKLRAGSQKRHGVLRKARYTMAAQREGHEQALSIGLDAATAEALRRAAAERDVTPESLVSRWVRERLAHEAERARGRSRPQRPGA